MILIHLPAKAQGEGICFAWKQLPTVEKPVKLPLVTTPLTTTQPPELGAGYDFVGIVGHVDTVSTDLPYTDFVGPEDGFDETTMMPGYNLGTVEVNDESLSEGVQNDQPVHYNVKKTKFGTKGKKVNYKVNNEDLHEEGTGTYKGCWAIDNIIIVNTANVPTMMQDGFDPVNPSEWLAFPGAHFKVNFLLNLLFNVCFSSEILKILLAKKLKA